MDDRLAREVAAIADDHRSGASALLRRALAVLRQASATGPASLEWISPQICRAQPSMGAIWNAVCAALGADDPVRTLDRFERETDRAAQAVTQVAATLLSTGDGPSRLATCSASGTVARVFEAVGARRELRVVCAEGRPVYEGRAMAAGLAAAGFVVEMYTDAAVGAALGSSDALLLGADAVSGDWVINKTGSAQTGRAGGRVARTCLCRGHGRQVRPTRCRCRTAVAAWTRGGGLGSAPSRRDGPESVLRAAAAHPGPRGPV